MQPQQPTQNDPLSNNNPDTGVDLPNSPAPEAAPQVSQPQPVEPQKSGKKKWLIAAAVLVVLAAGGTAAALAMRHPKTTTTTTTPTKVIRIGISMDTMKELRWQKDRQYLEADAKAAGASATILVADGDDTTQVSQIENLISQKVDVLIVVPHNSAAVVPAIAEAHKAGIKVISYDRLALGSDIDFYVSFDNDKVGQNSAQYVVDKLPTGKVAKVAYVGGAPTDNNAGQIHTGAMKVLDPLIKANKVQLVYDQPTTDWQPDLAYQNLKAYLDKGNTVDGVICANDGTAFGAIKALQEHGLAGKVPVTGQDADLPAVQRLVDGTQTMTNYKSIKLLSKQAISAAMDFAQSKKPATNATVDNNTTKVAAFYLTPVPVTKDNIKDTVVKDGFLSEQEIYNTKQ